MSGTREDAALSMHRDVVAELVREGMPLADVEDSIDASGLGADEKAGLFRYALSLREPAAEGPATITRATEPR